MKYFKFYPADFLIGIQYLNSEEVGIYIKMLCYQWDKGYVPTDKNIFKSLFGKDIPDNLKSKFYITEDGNGYINERLSIQRNEAINKSNKLKENGIKGAEVRWSNNSDDFSILINNESLVYFKIKNQIINENPSDYFKKWHKSFMDIQCMKLKLPSEMIRGALQEVFAILDTDYSFYDFNSQNHLKNTFKSILNKIVNKSNSSGAKLSINGSQSFD